MATTIRLKRVGRNKQAHFRIVVTDSRKGPNAPSIERLGIYNPRTRPSLIRIDAARTIHWLHEGAEPSDSVRSLLRQTGVWEKWHAGAKEDELEEAEVSVGPPAGQRKTSQRPMPDEAAERAKAAEEKAAAGAPAAAATEVAVATEVAEEAPEPAEEPAEAEAAPAGTEATDEVKETSASIAEAEEDEAEAEADDIEAEAEADEAEDGDEEEKEG